MPMKTIEIRAIKFLFDIVLLMFLLINNYLLSDKKLFPQTVILHYILDLHTAIHSKSTISRYYSIWLHITQFHVDVPGSAAAVAVLADRVSGTRVDGTSTPQA